VLDTNRSSQKTRFGISLNEDFMLAPPNVVAADSIGGSGHGVLLNEHASFAARFRDLRFLEGADPVESGSHSLGSLTCGWDYGCLRSLPDWFTGYIAPESPARDLPSAVGWTPGASVGLLLDLPTNPMHANEADAMVCTALPIPEPVSPRPDSFGRSFGCFLAGTQIATEHGPMPIESLGTGHLVHTVRDGRLKPIVWTGHRTIDCERHPRPARVWPIRISASAFGPNMPQRDLLLSPDHAVYWIDALIPVRCLVNDRTITQMPVADVTYFHLELRHHDVVLAEGMAAETFLDTGPEAVFHGHGSPIGLYPDLASRLWDAKACAPLVVAGPILDSLRQWLAITAAPPSQPAKRTAKVA